MAADRQSGFGRTLLVIVGLIVCPLGPVVGQQATEAMVPGATDDASEGAVSFGIEELGVEEALRQIALRQARLEQALTTLEARINEVAGLANATNERIAQGEDPLVSLEIEQLWSVIRALERDNAVLREELDVLLAAPPDGAQGG